MFSAEKLLGGLLKDSLGLRRRSSSLAVGSGLLGVAFAAAEHFMNKAQTQPSGENIHTNTPPPRQAPGSNAPPPPPGTSSSAPPPPPPGAGTPPPPPASAENSENDAVLLIQAMIASAASDGEIDEQEKKNIIDKLESVELSGEERDFIQKELASPCTLDTITNKVNSPEMARQVYTVSIMAIEVDTDAERDYLNNLALKLNLDQSVKNEIHKELGVSF